MRDEDKVITPEDVEASRMSVDELTRMTIEASIDQLGLAHFLGLVADVCDDKRAHVLSTWQDDRLAMEWEQARVLLVDVMEDVNV